MKSFSIIEEEKNSTSFLKLSCDSCSCNWFCMSIRQVFELIIEPQSDRLLLTTRGIRGGGGEITEPYTL